MENEKRGVELNDKVREKMMLYREGKCDEVIFLQDSFRLPVVTLRANYPGASRDRSLSGFIVTEVAKELDRTFEGRILHREGVDTSDGPMVFLVVRGDAGTIKENTVYVEESHELGRFSDIDVYECFEAFSISRLELGYPPRRCYLCQADARECAQKRRHDLEELSRYVKDAVSNYRMKDRGPGSALQGSL